jgi:hypothetical protein
MTHRPTKTLIIGALLLSAAPAFPASGDTRIHMVCNGDKKLPNGRLDMNSVLSLTVNTNARGVGTVTVGGYPPMDIMPEIIGSNDIELHFRGWVDGPGMNHMGGFLNRITGQLFVNFDEDAPKGHVELFGGSCKPAQKLF